jgi:hypothetical protein
LNIKSFCSKQQNFPSGRNKNDNEGFCDSFPDSTRFSDLISPAKILIKSSSTVNSDAGRSSDLQKIKPKTPVVNHRRSGVEISERLPGSML